MAKPFTYTAVITSCQRHESLRRVLESLLEFADILPERTVVAEDSGLVAPEWYWQLPLQNKSWLANGKRRGQGYTIDRGYGSVRSGYILHLEDDRPFVKPGPFLLQSFEILEAHRDVAAVMLHGVKVWMRKYPEYPVPLYKPSIAGLDTCYDGISFANGLRRIEDYHLVGGDFARFELGRDIEKLEFSLVEPAAGREYHRRGFVMATLEEEYCTHIGESVYAHPKGTVASA